MEALGIFAGNIIGKSSLEKAIRTPPTDKRKGKNVPERTKRGDVRRYEKF